MKCPVCNSYELALIELEWGLPSFKCPNCNGNWIRGVEYWKWLEEHGPNLPERPDPGEGLSLVEPGKYVDCPECRFRMVKFLVGRGFDFTLDHCEGCKGIWLDRYEWDALKKRNLHDDMHTMLTSFWQSRAQKEVRRKNLAQIYANRFGADDYTEIKRVRAWLDSHAHKHQLLAYLTDEDPYGV